MGKRSRNRKGLIKKQRKEIADVKDTVAIVAPQVPSQVVTQVATQIVKNKARFKKYKRATLKKIYANNAEAQYRFLKRKRSNIYKTRWSVGNAPRTASNIKTCEDRFNNIFEKKFKATRTGKQRINPCSKVKDKGKFTNKFYSKMPGVKNELKGKKRISWDDFSNAYYGKLMKKGNRGKCALKLFNHFRHRGVGCYKK